MTDRPDRAQTLHDDGSASLGDRLDTVIGQLDGESVNLCDIIDRVGEQGLLLLAALLTVVFLIPVSIPGVSTVFGAAILLIGISRLSGRPLWLPRRLRARRLPAARVQAGLRRGMAWVRRVERVSRPHRLRALAEGRLVDLVNNLAFILAALLLMAPFGFIPFSNTLPGIALLFYAIGLIQRDGVAILVGHVASLATITYFAALIGGGGYALQSLWQRITG